MPLHTLQCIEPNDDSARWMNPVPVPACAETLVLYKRLHSSQPPRQEPLAILLQCSCY